jgi:CRP-like cAMP-binding protein
LKDFFNKIHKVDSIVLDNYLDLWNEYNIPKKTIITREEETESYLYFIDDGLCKSYYLNEAKEHIMFFAYPPSFCGVVESFLTQTPSKYFLESITDCTFRRISYSVHSDFISENREMETFFRKLTEQFLVGIIERHHELMAFNAEQRFRNFMGRSSHLLNLIPQKDIASYLRIDPTNFSKLINSIKI